MSEIDELKRELCIIVASTAHKAPWLSVLIRKLTIIAVDDKNYPPAGVSDTGQLLINVSSWSSLKSHEKQFILLHEALHIGLEHFVRCRTISGNFNIYNLAADCVVNQLLIQSGFTPPKGAVTPQFIAEITNVPVEQLITMSAEEIYHLLLRNKVNMPCIIDLPVGGQPKEGVQIQEGEIGKNVEEVVEKVRETVRKALVVGQFAGTAPAAVQRVVDEIFASKVNWANELRMAVYEGLGPFVISTWKRVNRRCPAEYPGYRRLSRPVVWAVVDVSGSIAPSTFNQFASELLVLSRLVKVYAIFFSDGVVAEEYIKPLSVHNLQITGGGGTVIAPALQKILGQSRRSDVVVILTDGLVIDEEEEKQLLQRLVHKVSRVIYCSTARFPKVRGIRTILIY